jgi:hypothetical protein
MQTVDHPQLAEVLSFLQAQRQCAVVDPDAMHEVAIELDLRSKWYVQAVVRAFPRPDVRKRLKAVGLRIRRREMRMHFGPDRGKTVSFFTIAHEFEAPEVAARVALAAFDILWAFPVTEWLWITSIHHDDRGEPKRPKEWPPPRV